MQIKSLVSFLFISLCCCMLLRGAETTGTIAGSVLDQSGASVPNAQVTATALATGLTRTTLSGSDGQFVIPLLPVVYLYAGDPSCPNGGFKTSWTEFGPRLGLAYNPGGNSRTTVRGGAGIFNQPPFPEAFGSFAIRAPFSPQYTLYSVPFMNPYQGTTNPFPAQYGPALPSANVATTLQVRNLAGSSARTANRARVKA